MDTIKLLIVEDEPIIANDLANRFQDAGYAVLDILESGEEALDLLQREQPDLILMDIELAGELDGIATVKLIRKQWDLPIIYLTSNTDTATFNQAKQTKPSAFLSKPFRTKDLQHAIELALSTYSKAAAIAEGEAPAPGAKETAFMLKDRIFVKDKNRLIRLLLSDIILIEASGCYCKLVTQQQDFFLTMTLKSLMERISGEALLMRVHRSYAVNIKEIEEIGELDLFLKNQKVPLGKSYREDLLRLLKML